MKSANPRIQSLKEMLDLEERRASLSEALDAIDRRMSALKNTIFSGSPVTSAVHKLKGPSRSGAVKSSGKRAQRGQLKSKIMASLEAAGSAGVRVKELAQAIGTKAVNVHSWFHSNIQRNPAIKKITGGHYRLGSGAKAAQTKANAPVSKAIGGEKRKGPSGGTKRGELSAKILAQLKNAGPQGISVSKLASKLGAKYKNIYIWFATTGKKNAAIKKVAPATYKLAS